MGLRSDLFGGMPHCKRCKVELSGTQHVCPRCNFAPKQIGLWWAALCVMGMVVAMILAQVVATVNTRIAFYFLLLAPVAFIGALLLFILAMLSTPYRFGRLFDVLSW